jgi:hypothetical protein
MTRPTDPLFDQRIADWLEDDPLHAPGQVLEIVLAALPSIPRRRASPVPRRLVPASMRWPLVAAAAIGALVIGGTLYLNRPNQPAVGGQSPTPGSSISPSQPANPTAGPSSTVVPARAASWTATGSMLEPFAGHTATRLLDGKVLVAGGVGSPARAELYDPGTGSWTTTGKMVTSRVGGIATLLPDGKVLVAGGKARSDGNGLASAELYDPGSGSWTATGSMTTPRQGHTATQLLDGRVLVAGGANADGNAGLASAELYDPRSGTWTATGSMTVTRAPLTAILLRDGRVLVAGGQCGGSADAPPPLASAELYDPGSGIWTATGSMLTPRTGHSLTLLLDGRVLATGGTRTAAADWAELYDPAGGTWAATGAMVTSGGTTAALLLDGKVLVVGGDSELYNPASGSWTATVPMLTPRGYSTATLLPDGRVLVAGGSANSAFAFSPMASAELYDPGAGQ